MVSYSVCGMTVLLRINHFVLRWFSFLYANCMMLSFISIWLWSASFTAIREKEAPSCISSHYPSCGRHDHVRRNRLFVFACLLLHPQWHQEQGCRRRPARKCTVRKFLTANNRVSYIPELWRQGKPLPHDRRGGHRQGGIFYIRISNMPAHLT